MKKWLGIFVCLNVLTACSAPYATNDKQQYLTSRNGDKLVIQPPLTHENISGFYDLPSPEVVSRVNLKPPTTQ